MACNFWGLPLYSECCAGLWHTQFGRFLQKTASSFIGKEIAKYNYLPKGYLDGLHHMEVIAFRGCPARFVADK
jgi:hypothetical protein